MIKAKFYFDFCDYRSYFVAKELELLGDLPMQVEWIALDSYSLRAMSGEAAGRQSELGQNYEREEAKRYAISEGIKLRWPQGSINSGLALRASTWIMEKRAAEFEAFSRKLLHFIWAEGNIIDTLTMQQSCEQFSFGLDEIMSFDSGRDQFAAQDRVLKQALADGVFDVPFLVLGTMPGFYGYGHTKRFRRAVLETWVQSQDSERLVSIASELLFPLRGDALRAYTDKLKSHQEGGSESSAYGLRRPIRQNIRLPLNERKIPAIPATSSLKLCFCEGDLLEAYTKSQPDTLAFALACKQEIHQLPSIIEKIKKKRLSRRTFLANIGLNGELKWLLIESSATATVSYRFLEAGEEGEEFEIVSIASWKAAILLHSASAPLLQTRLAAAMGAHLMVCAEASELQLAAMARVSERWLLQICEQGVLYDADGRGLRCADSVNLTWPAYHAKPEATLWAGDPARTLLLCEYPLSIGELRENADMELSCQGSSLLVATQNQKNLLSEFRTDERFSFGDETLTIVPVKEEQIFVSELLSYKLLESLHKTLSHSRMAIVNYWVDLEFSSLEALRALYASIVEDWKIPLIVVVGRQVIELWLCGSQSASYRVEKEGENFVLDLADVSTAQDWFDALAHKAENFLDSQWDSIERLGKYLKSEGKPLATEA
ncbi:MAG: hypothetical protein ACOX8U_03800 [Bradymonadia bacterium]|jgi:2-hydroxychromene-2-carboxylate isomerase